MVLEDERYHEISCLKLLFKDLCKEKRVKADHENIGESEGFRVDHVQDVDHHFFKMIVFQQFFVLVRGVGFGTIGMEGESADSIEGGFPFIELQLVFED